MLYLDIRRRIRRTFILLADTQDCGLCNPQDCGLCNPQGCGLCNPQDRRKLQESGHVT